MFLTVQDYTLSTSKKYIKKQQKDNVVILITRTAYWQLDLNYLRKKIFFTRWNV